MRKFWLRAALAASHLRDLISAGAYAVCTFGVALAKGCDGLALRCERRARGEAVLGLWARSFTWPGPPEGWRVETGKHAEFARRLERLFERDREALGTETHLSDALVYGSAFEMRSKDGIRRIPPSSVRIVNGASGLRPEFVIVDEFDDRAK